MMILLKGRRRAKGWSQMQLSMKSGIPQTTISAIECGKINSPTIWLMVKLARALGCNIEDLIDATTEAQ